jgi:hypothetical protein
MDHDAKCEQAVVYSRVVDRFEEGVENDNAQVMAMLKALRVSEQMCACLARRWGINVPLDVGLRLSEKKADRYVKSWLESGDEAQKRRVDSFVSRALGKNVISLEEYRDR